MRLEDIRIRDARLDDAALLAEIGTTTFIESFSYRASYGALARRSPQFFSPAIQAREIADDSDPPERRLKTLLAQYRDGALGFVQFRRMLGEEPRFEIVRLNVLLAFQRMGLAQMLLSAVDTITGSAPLQVWIPENHERGLAFFGKHGFQEESRRQVARQRFELSLVRDRPPARVSPVADEFAVRPRIFLSYSAKDARATQVLNKVVTLLRQSGFEPWIDSERLRMGETFPQQIFTEIFQCHGGVIIFSDTAAGSQWVQVEATVLAARSWHDREQFRLVPIFIPPEKPETVFRKPPFEALDLASRQSVTNPDSDAEMRKMIDHFEPLKRGRTKTPLDLLIEVVVRHLPEDRGILERAVHEALDDGAGNAASGDLAEGDPSKSASLLARSFFYIGLHAFRKALKQLAGAMTRSDASTVIEVVVPFWIDPKAVAPLARAALGQGKSIPMVNARSDMTVRMYIKRAAAEYPFHWVVIPVTAAGGEKTASAIIAEIRDSFRKTSPELADVGKSEIDERIAGAARLDPVIIIIPPTVRVETIKKVRAKYPDCTLFIRTGPTPPPRERYVGLDVVLLDPQLTPELESEVHDLYFACRRIADNIE